MGEGSSMPISVVAVVAVFALAIGFWSFRRDKEPVAAYLTWILCVGAGSWVLAEILCASMTLPSAELVLYFCGRSCAISCVALGPSEGGGHIVCVVHRLHTIALRVRRRKAVTFHFAAEHSRTWVMRA